MYECIETWIAFIVVNVYCIYFHYWTTALFSCYRHCGISDPSWAELRYFVCFLNTQLIDFKSSDFLTKAAAEDLPGFSKFVLRFLIQMSRVNISYCCFFYIFFLIVRIHDISLIYLPMNDILPIFPYVNFHCKFNYKKHV